MRNEQPLTPQGKEALESKIQQLEQEVKLLRESLRNAKSSPELTTATPDIGFIKNAWLISFGQNLLLEPDKSSIHNALERLGYLFNLQDASIWRTTAAVRKQGGHSPAAKKSSQYQCLGQWLAEPNPRLQTADWLTQLWRADSPLIKQLEQGLAVTLLADDPAVAVLTAPLRAQHILSSLLVPVLRFNLLEGFIVLHRHYQQAWSPRDIERLTFIANALFIMNDRQELVRQLSDRDTRFNYAIEASSDGLWDWNISTGKIYFSRNYLRMLGYHYEELPGNLTALHEYFLHSEDTQKVMQRYQEAIEKCETHVNLQFRMLHQSGKILWIQSKAKFCEPDGNGHPTRCVGLNTDISEFIHAHEELLAAKTQADMANNTKSEFLARMSHEIRTPMNAIMGLGYLLKDTHLDEQQKSYLSSLNSAADSLLHIINTILDFSKIDASKVTLEQANFDLDSLFEKLSRLFEISANHTGARILYDIKADVPRFLRGDAERLSQIIGHLISNALQYSGTHEVVVGVSLCEASNNRVLLEFSVTDFGKGMSAERLATVKESLQKHVRISDIDRSRFGLGICRHLIELMHGSLRIDSELGKGCRVQFSVGFDNSYLGAKIIHKHRRELNNIRALVVDDNLIARTVISATAKNIGMLVEQAENAEQALEKINQADAKAKPFHFILMDYRMPNMNGMEAAATIKAYQHLTYSPHIIMVSAYHRDEISTADKINFNVDEFLSKPISESRLAESITNAISNDKVLQAISKITGDDQTQIELLKSVQVLVVEDNLVNQQVVRGVLKKKGVRVLVANNGVEALAIINQCTDTIDAVLMDLEMPEMNGIDATKAIRKGHCMQDVPIIALTAQAMRGDREHCLAVGMNAYLSKPIIPEVLYTTLAEQIHASRAKKNV
jgi:two-component system, sensor histidine kinase and response regulator